MMQNKEKTEKERQTEILEEILKWIKIGNKDSIKKKLEKNLDSDLKKIVYQYSNGNKTTRDFGDISVKRSTVAKWWEEWKTEGILEGVPTKGGGERGKKMFELNEFGISVPKNKKESSKTARKEK